jgi:predicted membrane protein
MNSDHCFSTHVSASSIFFDNLFKLSFIPLSILVIFIFVTFLYYFKSTNNNRKEDSDSLLNDSESGNFNFV